MSVELPVVAIAFGSVAPPQGDILELRVNLGCTREVSSFECLLINFDKKYTETNPITIGSDCSISIGRGTNCPLILTGRVEEIECESTPVENYIRVRGRCWGERLFRRVVTKTYENMKGEEVVKDLIDSYVGLSHNRISNLTEDAAAGQFNCVVADGSKFRKGDKVEIKDDNNSEWNQVASVSGNTVTMVNALANTYTVLNNGKVTSELIEDTDTTYTLLEYENTPAFEILKYIAESSSKAGMIGFDFRVEYDGKFAFFPRNSKVSPVSLSERIEVSEYRKDIHRIRNKITVYGAAEKARPSDKDAWTESLTPADGAWSSGTGTGSVSLDSTEKIFGSYCVKHSTTTPDYYGCAIFTLNAGQEVDCNKYPNLTVQIKEESAFSGAVTIQLEDTASMIVRKEIRITNNKKWHLISFPTGKKSSDQWTHSVFNTQPFDWTSVKKICFYGHFADTGTGAFWIDNMFFNGRRWVSTKEDANSQSLYGVRELVEVDEELHSDSECSRRAEALLNFLKDSAEYLTLQSDVIDFEANRLLSGDKIRVVVPNEKIDADYRILSVEYRAIAREQVLEVTLDLGKEPPLLADMMFDLRAKTGSLARCKAGPTGVAGTASGGGGGAGPHATSHETGGADKVHFADLEHDEGDATLHDSLTAIPHISQAEKDKIHDRLHAIDSTQDHSGVITDAQHGTKTTIPNVHHREWGWADEQSWVKTLVLPYSFRNDWTREFSNPVIPRGSYAQVCGAKVIYINGIFYAYCCVAETAPWGNRNVHLWKSTNGINFTYVGRMLSNVPNTWEHQLGTMHVIYDSYANKYKGWYEGGTSAGVWKIGYAYADDPEGPWTKYPSNPLSVPNYKEYIMSVMRLGNLYWSCYKDTNNEISQAFSNDGITWSDRATILTKGSAGQWDDNAINEATIYWNLGVWYFVYSGQSSAAGNPVKIGFAQSSTGFGTFTKCSLNPIMTLGASGQWDDKMIAVGTILQIEKKFYLYYHGDQTATPGWQIGLATIP